MIISASRRTDIPAFYSDWFMKRVREGYFCRVNPFNSRQVSGFSLKPEHVDAICFWTKNPRPLMMHLDELEERGLNFYVQFTLNPYPLIFEPNVPPLPERIETFVELADRIGPHRVVLRYDPVILSNITPVAWHLEQAERLAERLNGATRRLVFSFCDFYGRGEGRLRTALTGNGILLDDITAPDRVAALEQLTRGFKNIADRNMMLIATCSEEIDLAFVGIPHGACIDGNLIRELFGVTASLRKDRNQRGACNCVESVDMGMYNSCPFRCAYCYANYNEGMIERNLRKYDPGSPLLIGTCGRDIEIRTLLHKRSKI
jgi:DNA repair photolyase